MRKLILLPVITLLAVGAFAVLSSSKVEAAFCSYVGGNGGNWSDSGNWSGGCGGSPADGDSINIPNNISTNNDLLGLTLDTLNFTGSPGGTLSGNDLHISSAIQGSFPHVINVQIILEGDVSLATHSYNGGINMNGHNLVADPSVLPWGISGNVTGSGNMTFSNDGTIYLTGGGVGYSGTINIDFTTELTLEGSGWDVATTVHLTNYGVFFGDGADVFAITTDSTGNIITPQHLGSGNPDIMHITTMTLGSSDQIRVLLNGDLTSDYDQIIATGAIDITDVTFYIEDNYIPSLGDTFTVVSAASITGTFHDLPDGTIIDTVKGKFEINYTSTDITLTAVTGKCTWNGSVDNKWSTPGNWDAGCSGAGGIPANRDSIYFAGTVNPTNINDIDGLRVYEVNFRTSGFVISGNLLDVMSAIQATQGADVNMDLQMESSGTLGSNNYSGTINFGGGTLLLSADLRDITASAHFVGSGHLNFAGSHRIVLTGNSPGYTGFGTIDGSSSVDLYINADFSNGAFAIGNNSTVMGTGSVRNLSIGNGATFYPVDLSGNPSIFTVTNTLYFDGGGGGILKLGVFGNTPGVADGYSQIIVGDGGIYNLSQATLVVDNSVFSTIHDVLIFIKVSGTYDSQLNPCAEGYTINFGSMMEFHYTDHEIGVRGIGIELFNFAFSSNPTHPTPGQPFTITTTWTGTGSVPTGTVELFNGDESLGTAELVDGTATFDIDGLPEGTYNFTVLFSGDFAYGGAISSPLVLGVQTAALSNTGIEIPIGEIIALMGTLLIGTYLMYFQFKSRIYPK